MNKKILYTTVLSSIVLFSFSANAEKQDMIKINTIEQPEVSLTSSSSQEVQGDKIVIKTKYIATGKTSLEVQKKLSEMVGKTKKDIEEYRENKNISFEFNNVSVRPVYSYTKDNDQPRISSWEGEATLKIMGKEDFSDASILASNVNEFVIENVSFELSHDKTLSYEDETIKNAITTFHKKAKLITSSFGYEDYQILDVSVSYNGENNNFQPRPMYNKARAVMMTESFDAGSQNAFDFTPSKFNLSAEVSGKIKMFNKN